MHILARTILIAFQAALLGACVASENWYVGPSFPDDSESVWLYDLIEGKPLGDDESYWKVKIPRSEFPEEFLQAFECEPVNLFGSGLVLLSVYFGRCYTSRTRRKGLMQAAPDRGGLLLFRFRFRLLAQVQFAHDAVKRAF